MKFGIVVTTIFEGAFLEAFYEQLRNELAPEKIRFYVVGDLSTPEACRNTVQKHAALGMACQYLGVDEQNAILAGIPELAAQIPWRSDNRRNVGFLAAYRDGCDTIISIDDDNFPIPGDSFIAGHSHTGQRRSLPIARGSKSWFNLCSLMSVDMPSLGAEGTIYARGFPYSRRSPETQIVDTHTEEGMIAVNAGLWTGDPDVDAATRLVTHCIARPKDCSDYLLADGTLMPINTQNTSIIRSALPSYYYVRMGHSISGMKLDRFGDIFSGYFLQKCVQAVGHRVRVGSPILEHRRSPHNLYKDLWNELAGMVIIEDMLPLLEEPLSKASSYEDATLELADRIDAWSSQRTGFMWDDSLRDYFKQIGSNMRLWVAACRQLA